jgi:hypothetical protein
MKIKEMPASSMRLLPPPPDKCQLCACDHPANYPHNQQSLFWQYKFYEMNGRWPTWHDAMAHCEPGLRRDWAAVLLRDHGIDIGPEPESATDGSGK